MAGPKRTRDKEDERRRRAPRYFRPVDPKQAHIQQLNDELAEDIIAASERSPLVMLGIDTVGIEQMTTLFNYDLTAARFRPRGFDESFLGRVEPGVVHDPASPVDTTKPTVMVGAKNMARRGIEGSRSDIGHEFIHAGIFALANGKRHNIGPGLEEAIARHHDMVTGNPEEQATVRAFFKRRGWSHKHAEDAYNQLNKKAAKRLRLPQTDDQASIFEVPDDGGREMYTTKVY